MEYIEQELQEQRSNKNVFETVIDLSVLDLKDDIRKAIKERWLKGEGVNGGKIGTYYNLSYKGLKLLKNPNAGGNVDLTFTGALGDNITLIKDIFNNYEIISTDSKYNKLGKKYGFDEFGLSDSETVAFMRILEIIISTKLNNL